MPRRKTVRGVRAEYIERCLEKNGWSNTYFSSNLMQKTKGWITEWKRGKNLPSPEEAARMCAILQVRPEEILTEPEDIELVQGLIDSQREKPTPEHEGRPFPEDTYYRLNPKNRKLADAFLDQLLALQSEE